MADNPTSSAIRGAMRLQVDQRVQIDCEVVVGATLDDRFLRIAVEEFKFTTGDVFSRVILSSEVDQGIGREWTENGIRLHTRMALLWQWLDGIVDASDARYPLKRKDRTYTRLELKMREEAKVRSGRAQGKKEGL